MSKHHEDIIMKAIMELFKGDAVKFFGLDTEIVSATRTELLNIITQKNIDDWVLTTADGSFLHLEFQSTYDKKDISRFMVADAMLYHKEYKPIKTIVVYSADVEESITTISAGSINYSIEAFYMKKLDGDNTYATLKAKIDAGEPLTKQDIMSVVFLPLMKNSVDRVIRIEQSVELSKEISRKEEQDQIQAMLYMLAEKFISNKETLRKVKEMMTMGAIAEMIRDDERIAIAKKMLQDGVGISVISKYTGLHESIIREMQAKADSMEVAV